jgi:hypothetical protein
METKMKMKMEMKRKRSKCQWIHSSNPRFLEWTNRKRRYTLGCDIENGQEFVEECPDVVLIDQVTFTEIG